MKFLRALDRMEPREFRRRINSVQMHYAEGIVGKIQGETDAHSHNGPRSLRGNRENCERSALAPHLASFRPFPRKPIICIHREAIAAVEFFTVPTITFGSLSLWSCNAVGRGAGGLCDFNDPASILLSKVPRSKIAPFCCG